MYAGKEILAIIPARGGSKRLPRKNVLRLGGDPLIAWSIRAALSCPYIDHVVVSTEDEEIAAVSRKYGAKIHPRPPHLALDDTPSLPVFVDCLQQFPNSEIVMVLQPTSPFRKETDLAKAIETVVDQQADALISVTKMKLGSVWALTVRQGLLEFPPRQALDAIRTQDQDFQYQPNGNIYVYTRQTLLNADRYAFGERTLPLVMAAPYDLDIDDAVGFRIAEAIAHEFDLHCP